MYCTLDRPDLLHPWSWNRPTCRETACIKVKPEATGNSSDMGFERERYGYCGGAAAMAVGSPRGVQDGGGGDVRVWPEQRRGHGRSGAALMALDVRLGGSLMFGSLIYL